MRSKTPKKPDGRRVRRGLTETKIRKAVATLIATRGPDALGINAIAETAGVDKVLIYRYFGDLDGLLRSYGESADFWPSLDDVLGPDRAVLNATSIGEVASRIMVNYLRALRQRPETLAVLAWECAHRNGLTAVLEETRERWSRELMAEVRRAWPFAPPMVFALASILSAAVNYLAIRGREIQLFGGLDLGSEEGWAAIEAAIGAALRATANADNTPSRGERP